MTSSSSLPAVPADCPWDIVLGIDPGTRICGYGAVVDASDGPRLLAAGDVRPRGGKETPRRLGSLRAEIDTLLERLRPSTVVVEGAFGGVNVQSALRVGEARGVILSCAANYGASIKEYAPSVARRTLLGNGNASKEQTAAVVATLLKLEEPPRPLDVTDALALALAFVHRGRSLAALTSRTSKSRLRS